MESLKRNIEIRFLMKPSKAKKLLAVWKSEKRAIKPYSFVDYYYTLGNLQAKVRHWRSAHTPRTEIILFHRRGGSNPNHSRGTTARTREHRCRRGHPETATLAIGRIGEMPVVRGGQVVIRSIMPLSLSFDHRVIGAVLASRFVNMIIKFLQDPAFLLQERG